MRVIMTGEVTSYLVNKDMIHPDYEILDDDMPEELMHFKRIVPIYSETEGLHQKSLRRIVANALHDYARFLQSPIPADICRKRNLMDMGEAIRTVHFPP